MGTGEARWQGNPRLALLHIGVDADGMILARSLTDRATDDASVVPLLLDQLDDEVERFTGDGAYDTRAVYDALSARGTRVVVPPSRTATVSGKRTAAGMARDANVTAILERGRRAWKCILPATF